MGATVTVGIVEVWRRVTGRPLVRSAAIVLLLWVVALSAGGAATGDASERDGDATSRTDGAAAETTAGTEAGMEADAAAFVREVAPGHFVHVGRHEDMSRANRGDVATIGFVVGDDAVAVIDPGGSSEVARALERAIRAHTALPVTHVVLTHFHPDHVLGGHVFADAGVVVAHARHARAAVQRAAFYIDRHASLLAAGAGPLVPTVGVEPGADIEIALGGRTLTVTAWPTAHTDNDISVLDAAGGVLWAGDLLVVARTPSLDGSLVGWLATLDRLAALDVELVVPGHGKPAPPDAIIAPERRYLASLLGTTRARIAAGDGLSEALAEAERSPPGPWRLYELHHPANVTRAWTELEWE